MSQLVQIAVVLAMTTLGCATRQVSDQSFAGIQVQGLPTRWIDLPESPLRIVITNDRAALINQSGRTIHDVSVGCVRGPGVVEVVGSLVTVGSPNGWPPGQSVSILGATVSIEQNLTDPNYRKLYPNLQYCADDLRVAVVGVSAKDGYEWLAAGTPWPRSRTAG